MKEIITTDYIPSQPYYLIPSGIKHSLSKVEVYNKKKNSWDKVDFSIAIVLHRRELKTDKQIKIYCDYETTIPHAKDNL